MAGWVIGLYPGGSQQIFPGDSFPFKAAPRIFVLHSTETAGFPTYAYNKAPHVTVNPRTRTWRQHQRLDRPSWSLQAPSGISTNSWGAIQLEIIGYAANLKNIDQDDLNWLGGLIRMLCEQTGIQIQSSVTFGGSETSGVNGSKRLSTAQWYGYSGILGHQHVPGNSHWDPGAIDIDQWLAAINGTPPVPVKSKEYDMYMITSPSFGTFVFGAGYWRSVGTKAEADALIKAGVPAPINVTDDEANFIHTAAVQGEAPAVSAAGLTATVSAQDKEDIAVLTRDKVKALTQKFS